MALNRRELFQRLVGRLPQPDVLQEGARSVAAPARSPGMSLVERYEATLANHAQTMAWGISASELPASRDTLREELLSTAASQAASPARRAQLCTAYASLAWFCSDEDLPVLRAGQGAFDAQDWSETGQAAIAPAFALRKRLLDEVGSLKREFDAGLRRSQTRLRRAVPDDAPAIAQLWIAARQVRIPGLPFEARTGGIDFETERWRNLLEDGASATWVAALAGEMLATCRVVTFEEAEIESLFVLPREWGNGYGGALMELALGDPSIVGRDIVTWIPEANETGERLMSKLGFLPDGASRVDPSFPGSSVRHARFRKALSGSAV
jgi:RimJ/RimL family protein N-acetyltransferase